MSGRGLVWQAIVSVERILPRAETFALTAERFSSRRRRALMALVLLPVWLGPLFGLLMRHRGEALRAAWPALRTQFAGLMLIVAAALLVAIVAGGLMTWTRETRARRIGL